MMTFLIAVLLGFLTPNIEKPVAKPLAQWLRSFMEVAEHEEPVIAFMLSLLGAALVAVIFDSDAVLGVAGGVVLGYFGKRLFNVVKKLLDGKVG